MSWVHETEEWNATHNLPKPLYRHCAAAIALGEKDNLAGVMAVGEKTTGRSTNGEWYLW